MPEPDAALIDAVVVYALPARAYLFEVQIRAGSSVRAAIEASGLLSTIPELAGKPLDVGIFGRCCRLEDPVRDGDRIEVYRPLTADPKVARRRRALLKSD